jgi:tetratricopeptide (TPR) repeat protein
LIYSGKKKDIEALKAFTTAIKINPKRAPASYYYNRGFLWYKLDKLNKAFDDFNETIKRDDKYAKAYYYRSEIWRKWRKFINAQRDMSKACGLDNTLCIRGPQPSKPTPNKPPENDPSDQDD